ncbi:hypothetical protein [Micromonospora chersina]
MFFVVVLGTSARAWSRSWMRKGGAGVFDGDGSASVAEPDVDALVRR